MALGISIGLCLTGSLVAPPLAATIFATVIICNNVLAALFSRLGRFIDGIKRISNPQKTDFFRKNLSQIEGELFNFKKKNIAIFIRPS